MTPTALMVAIEHSHGRPLRDILLELYRDLRDWAQVAKRIGVSRQALFSWRLRLGLSDEVVLTWLMEQSTGPNAEAAAAALKAKGYAVGDEARELLRRAAEAPDPND